MSLYDGLDIDGSDGGSSTKQVAADWSSGYKLLHSQLQAKKANPSQQKKSRREGPTLAPVVDLKRQADSMEGPLHFNLQTGKLEQLSSGPVATAPVSARPAFIANDPVPSFAGIVDEYDPLRPNDYEEIMKKRKEKLKERDEDHRKEREERRNQRRERHRQRDEEHRHEREMDRARRRHEQEEEEEIDRSRKSGSGAAIAPPQSLLEEQPIPAEEPDPQFDRPSSPTSAFGYSIGVGGSVASKIMAKYGYKEGQGLGKQEQGMSTALYVEKTSKRGGKIIHEKDMPKETPREPVPNTNLLRNPSKVILLRNMVGPGEVDDDLEPETMEECNNKYGKVVKCLIFEIPGVSDEEAVRIFVEFERVEHAIKAIVDLNGRYFGGRIVSAGFYNLDKFRRLDLADEVE